MRSETLATAIRNPREATPDGMPEACIKSRDQGNRLTREMIGVEPQADGGFEASFSLQLAGIHAKALDRGTALLDAAILEHLFTVPEAGERMELRYHWQPENFAPELTFRVRGVTTGDDRTTAIRNVVRLFVRMSAMLRSRRDCKFTSVTPQASQPAPHRARVTFPGLLVSLQRRPVALRPDSGFSSILLPSLSFTEARVPFWRALTSCPFGLDVVLTIEPARVDAAGTQALAAAIQLLRLQRAEVMIWPEHRPLHVEERDLWRAHIERTMRRWLQLPRGMRLAIAFESPQAVPDASLGLLARTLFQGRAVAVERADAQREMPQNTAQTLVLADCVHETASLPELLPTVECLGAIPLPQHFPEPVEALPESGLVLGEVGDHPVCLSDNDRNRHLYVVGATGCGKSTVLLNLIQQDMAAGHGVCVIDPHGDLFAECLKAVPAHRADQVVMIDVGDYDFAAGLNLLETTGPRVALQRSFIANEMIKIFDRLYDMRIAGGPIFEQYTRAALALLMDSEFSGLTLCEVPTIFEDKRIRSRLIERCTNESVKRFWLHQAQCAGGETSLDNIAPYITSKFNQFTHNALIRPIIGQSRSTIRFREVMDSRGILLVNLSKGLLGEMDSALLGMLIIGKIFGAALGRTELPPSERAPFALYVDEFQNFATETMGMLLAESRKYGVQLTLANQSLAQIENSGQRGSIASSVLANVGTMIAMRLGNLDAERLNPLFSPEISRQDMTYLPDFHAAVRLLHAGRPMRPFVMNTLPNQPQSAAVSSEVERTVRENYRQQHSKAVTAVANEISERHQNLKASESQQPVRGQPTLQPAPPSSPAPST